MKKESFESQSFVLLGERLRKVFGGQSQYLTRYFNKDYETAGYSYLGEGLRIEGTKSGDWHSITIHPDDCDEAIRRLEKIIPKAEAEPTEGVDINLANLPDWLK